MSKKILITGGAGFIAHHVIDKILSTTDWEIITLDRLDFSGNLNRLHEVVSSYDEQNRKRVRVVYHDLKAELNPEIVASSEPPLRTKASEVIVPIPPFPDAS